MVHISAIVEAGPAGFQWVWLLHPGVFVVFVPFVFMINRTQARIGNLQEAFFKSVPWPALALGFVLFVYTGVNFLVVLAKSGGGVPDIWQGVHVLHDHGRLIREITEIEYIHYRFNEIRGFSGHWLIFYFAPLSYFYTKIKGPAAGPD